MNTTRERNFHNNTVKYALVFIENSNAKFKNKNKNDKVLKRIINENIKKITDINKFFIKLSVINPDKQLLYIKTNIMKYNSLELTVIDAYHHIDFYIDAYHIDMYLYELLKQYFDIFQLKLIKMSEGTIMEQEEILINDLIKKFNYYNQYNYVKYSKYIMRIRELYKCLLMLENIDENIIKLIKDFFDKIKDSEIAMNITKYILQDIYKKNEENITKKYKSMLEYVSYDAFIKNIDEILESQKPKPKPQEEVKKDEIEIDFEIDLKKSSSSSKSKSKSKSNSK
jgi:hypothetical protein